MFSQFQKLLRSLVSSNLPFVSFIFGEELFQKFKVIETLKSNSDWSFKSFEAAQFEESTFEDLVRCQDLFSPNEILVFFDSQKLVSKKFIEKHLRGKTIEGKALFFFIPKVDKKKIKELESEFTCIEIREPYEREWKSWKALFETSLKMSIEDSLWEALGLWFQKNLKLAEQELIKLSLFAQGQSTLKLSDYEKLTLGKVNNVFDWVESVITKNKTKAIYLYHCLKKEEESEIKMLSLLIRQYQQLWDLCTLKEKGTIDSKTIASQLGIHPFFLSGLEKQASLYQKSELATQLNRLTELDYSLKIGRGNLFTEFLL